MKPIPEASEYFPKPHNSSSKHIRVIARFRPLLAHEIEQGNSPLSIDFSTEDTIMLPTQLVPDPYRFDKVLSTAISQQEVYETAGEPTIEEIMLGYNGTIFAYGQTGSGKTYTMMGSSLVNKEEMGLIPRIASKIFDFTEEIDTTTELSIKCSMLEIHREKLYDLLAPDKTTLKIIQRGRTGVAVDGLTEYYVSCLKELLELISVGETSRTVAATKLNAFSSRSHQLFMLTVKQRSAEGTEKTGVLHLVDLAGSENVRESKVQGDHLEEAKKINLSLSALGNVIHALTSKQAYIPYRDSKLTRLLQESLGGNFKTTLLVACSVNACHIDETIRTLRFAQRAKKIKNTAGVNIVNTQSYCKVIAELRAELFKTQEKIRLLTNKPLVQGETHKRRMFNRKATIQVGEGRQEIDLHKQNSVIGTAEIEIAPELESPKHVSEVENEESLRKVTKLKEKNKKLENSNKKLTAQIRKLIDKKIELEHSKFFDNESKFEVESETLLKDNEIIVLKIKNRELEKSLSDLKFYLKHIYSIRLQLHNMVSVGMFGNLPQHNLNQDMNIGLHVDPSVVNATSVYSASLLSSVENECEITPEISIFNLQNQVLQASIFNKRVIQEYQLLKIDHSILKHYHNGERKANKILKERISKDSLQLKVISDSCRKLIELYNKRQSAEPVKIAGSRIYRPLRKPTKTIDSSSENNSVDIQMNSVMLEERPVQDHYNLSYLTSQLEMQKFHIKQLMETNSENSIQIHTLRDQLKQQRDKYRTLISKSQEEFVSNLKLYKENYTNELIRRQDEITKLNETISKWIHSYMEIQETTALPSSRPSSSLLREDHKMGFTPRLSVKINPKVYQESVNLSPSFTSSDSEADDIS